MEIPSEPMNERVLDVEWSSVVRSRATCKMPHDPVQAFSQNMWTKQAKITHHPYPPSGIGGASAADASLGASPTASGVVRLSFVAGFSAFSGLQGSSNGATASAVDGSFPLCPSVRVIGGMVILLS